MSLILLAATAAQAQVGNGIFEVRIAERPDGVAVRKEVKRNVLATIDVRVETSGPFAREVALEADGLLMSVVENKDHVSPFHATIPWYPWHGNGSYWLTAWAGQLDRPGSNVMHRVRVEVGGMFYKTPAARDMMIKLYHQRFGLDLTSPPLARYCAANPAESRWVSTAYIGDTLYEIQLYDDLRDVATRRPINRESDDPSATPVTRPAGTYKVLVVFLDFGDTGITEAEAMDALHEAVGETNQRYGEFTSGTAATPLLHLDVEGAFAAYKPYGNRALIDPDLLKRRTGRDASAYDMIAQVDLRAGGVATNTTGALGAALHGYAGHGADGVNVWVQIRRREELATHLSRTLFDVEFNHVFGWQREWPSGDGGYVANGSAAQPPPCTLPTSLFGWVDLDGDHVPEIVDLTPYGLKNVPPTEKR